MKEEEKAKDLLETHCQNGNCVDFADDLIGLISKALHSAKLEGAREAYEDAARITESFPGIIAGSPDYITEQNSLRHKIIAERIRSRMKGK